jgi:hypothetical protein
MPKAWQDIISIHKELLRVNYFAVYIINFKKEVSK